MRKLTLFLCILLGVQTGVTELRGTFCNLISKTAAEIRTEGVRDYNNLTFWSCAIDAVAFAGLTSGSYALIRHPLTQTSNGGYTFLWEMVLRNKPPSWLSSIDTRLSSIETWCSSFFNHRLLRGAGLFITTLGSTLILSKYLFGPAFDLADNAIRKGNNRLLRALTQSGLADPLTRPTNNPHMPGVDGGDSSWYTITETLWIQKRGESGETEWANAWLENHNKTKSENWMAPLFNYASGKTTAVNMKTAIENLSDDPFTVICLSRSILYELFYQIAFQEYTGPQCKHAVLLLLEAIENTIKAVAKEHHDSHRWKKGLWTSKEHLERAYYWKTLLKSVSGTRQLPQNLIIDNVEDFKKALLIYTTDKHVHRAFIKLGWAYLEEKKTDFSGQTKTAIFNALKQRDDRDNTAYYRAVFHAAARTDNATLAEQVLVHQDPSKEKALRLTQKAPVSSFRSWISACIDLIPAYIAYKRGIRCPEKTYAPAMSETFCWAKHNNKNNFLLGVQQTLFTGSISKEELEKPAKTLKNEPWMKNFRNAHAQKLKNTNASLDNDLVREIIKFL